MPERGNCGARAPASHQFLLHPSDIASLVSQAKDERAAISAVLTLVAAGSAKLARAGKALDQVGQKVRCRTEAAG